MSVRYLKGLDHSFNWLIETLAEKSPFYYTGRTTNDEHREIMYYVTDIKKATDIMKGFIKANKFPTFLKRDS